MAQLSAISHHEFVSAYRDQCAGALAVTGDEKDIALVGRLQAARDSVRIGISALCYQQKHDVFSPSALAAQIEDFAI